MDIEWIKMRLIKKDEVVETLLGAASYEIIPLSIIVRILLEIHFVEKGKKRLLFRLMILKYRGLC